MPSVVEDIETAAHFGREANGGVTRLAWSAELFAAYDWLRERLAVLDVHSYVDAAGNFIACWTKDAAKLDGAVVVGSHLDTVPCGGRYDGALGVLCGLQAITRLKLEGFAPQRPIWLAAFMDEEGARFGTSLFGSRAFVGEDLAELGSRVDRNGMTLAAAMAEAGHDFGRVNDAHRVDDTSGYLELHIEQGPVLEAEGADIAVVSHIVAILCLRVTFSGQANHAGTTPMSMRHDALVGASRTAADLRAHVRDDQAGAVATVGIIQVEPSGSNIIPGRAEFTVDLRATDSGRLAELKAWLRRRLAVIASEEGLGLHIEVLFQLDPVPLEVRMQELFWQAAELDGARVMSMPSGAGHDAMVIAKQVPTGMVLLPSRAGISHSPQEFTSPSHCEMGVSILTRVLKTLAR